MSEPKNAPKAKAVEPLAWSKTPAKQGFYVNLIGSDVKLRMVTEAEVDSKFFARCGLWYGPLPVPLP